MNIEEFTAKIEEGRSDIRWGDPTKKPRHDKDWEYITYGIGMEVKDGCDESGFLDYAAKELNLPSGGVLWWRRKPEVSLEDNKFKVTFRCYIDASN